MCLANVIFRDPALGVAHFYLWNPRRQALRAPNVDAEETWTPLKVNGSLYVVNPHEKIELKFLGK